MGVGGQLIPLQTGQMSIQGGPLNWDLQSWVLNEGPRPLDCWVWEGGKESNNFLEHTLKNHKDDRRHELRTGLENKDVFHMSADVQAFNHWCPVISDVSNNFAKVHMPCKFWQHVIQCSASWNQQLTCVHNVHLPYAPVAVLLQLTVHLIHTNQTWNKPITVNAHHSECSSTIHKIHVSCECICSDFTHVARDICADMLVWAHSWDRCLLSIWTQQRIRPCFNKPIVSAIPCYPKTWYHIGIAQHSESWNEEDFCLLLSGARLHAVARGDSWCSQSLTDQLLSLPAGKVTWEKRWWQRYRSCHNVLVVP